jgi:glycosyltransferase involved in cell wall biosynthesis
MSFVLAMGRLGRRWFELCGYDDCQIFDFCYVVDAKGRPETVARIAPDNVVRIAYVGQLIRRKRVDLLLRALANQPTRNWMLDVVGEGLLRSRLERLVGELGIQSLVRFRGAMPNTEVQNLLSESDLLVLPSDWDGWGAVVNEALSAGTRVICSDRCGAADLVRDPSVGSVFRAGSWASLATALREVIKLGPVDSAMREEIRSFSATFGGPVIAEYLLGVVAFATQPTGPAPEPPWRRPAP